MTHKLTGHESSVLTFLAERPEHFGRFAATLGPDALVIAEFLAGRKDVPEWASVTGNAIIQWCQERRDRENL